MGVTDGSDLFLLSLLYCHLRIAEQGKMKLVLVLCACVAGSLAGLVQPFGYKEAAASGAGLGKYGADSLKAQDLLRDSRRGNAAAQLWSNAGQQGGRRASTYGDEMNKSGFKETSSSDDRGQNAAQWDQSQDAASRANSRDSQWAQAQNEWARKDAADKAAANNLWSEGNQFRQGKRNHDSIDYGFDKKFNTRKHEDGGYEYNESSDSHALDDYADRSAAYDKKRSDHVAQASKADAQAADRKAAFANNAAAAQASADKFGRDYDSSSWANGRNKDLAQKLDASQAGNRYWSDARDRALDAYSDMAARDSNAARNSQEFGDADGKYGVADYGYGVAGVKGYAPKPGAYPGVDKNLAKADYAKRAGAADLARLWDQSAKNGLKQAAKDSSKDEGKTSYSRDQWLNDRVQGYNKDQAAKANDHGFSDWANKADQSASGSDAKSANAASKSAASQGRWDLDENQWNKENRVRNLSDRKANKKVSKKFFHNNDNGGDNWERLNYDRDQVDDVFGHRAAIKKDASNSARDSRYNSAYDAAARKADAARAADAARQFSQDDWKKSANGWSNNGNSFSEEEKADRKGLRNEGYKNDVSQTAQDESYKRANAYDRGSDRYGSNMANYGKHASQGAQGYGASRAAAYPYAGAYGYSAPGYGYGYPAYGGYGYGGYPGYGYNGYY